MKEVLANYSPNNYNSSGPFAFVRMARKYDLDKDYNSINVPSYYFYPINTSSLVENIYYGKYVPNNESYAMHWYGGHPMSQQFNKLYTEDKAKISNDSISKIMREIK